jgi:hypothetical protein
MRADEVVVIEETPISGTVYNLTVEEDNSYVLSGIVTHNCICYKTAVLMDADAFVDRLKGWSDGNETWPEMDQYAGWLGVMGRDLGNVSLAVGLPEKLALWLYGDQAAMDAAADEYVLAGGGQLALPNV